MEMNTTSKILAGVCFVLGVMVFMDGANDIKSAFSPDNGPGYGPQTPNNGPYSNNNQGPAPYGPNPNQAQGPGYAPGYGPSNQNYGPNQGPGYGPANQNYGPNQGQGYGPAQGYPQYSDNGYNQPGYNEPGYNNNGYGPQQQPGSQHQYYNQNIQSGEVMLDEPTEPDGW